MKKIYYAIIYDDNGNQLEEIKFNPKYDQRIQSKSGKTYVIDLNASKREFIKGFLFRKYFMEFTYNVNIPEPLRFDKERVGKPLINTEDLDTIINSQVLRDLNNKNLKKGLFANLNFKALAIGALVFIFIVVIFFSIARYGLG